MEEHPSNAIPTRNPGVKSRRKKTSAAESSDRMKDLTIVKPVIYGNVGWKLTEKTDDGHTHQWTVYLRSYNNEDMSVYVKHVQFNLHPTFAQRNRIIAAPPYTLTETGWGEFDIAIKVLFQDSNEKPVTFHHYVKLHERNEDGTIIEDSGPVTSEFYDELVFTDPTLKMHKLLTEPKPSNTLIAAHNEDYELRKVKDLEKILEAKQKVKQDIEDLKKLLASKKEEIQEIKKKVEQ